MDSGDTWPGQMSPREFLQSLKRPKAEVAMHLERLIDDTKIEIVSRMMTDMADQAIDRHIRRARLAEQMIHGEPIDDGLVDTYGLRRYVSGDRQGREGEIIASNFYAAMTHLTEILLHTKEQALDALTVNNDPSPLERVLRKVDSVAGQLFEYEENLFRDEKSPVYQAAIGYAPSGRFIFEVAMDEADTHHHWNNEGNFYSHHLGQLGEITKTRPRIERNVDMGQFPNIQKLYERMEMVREYGPAA